MAEAHSQANRDQVSLEGRGGRELGAPARWASPGVFIPLLAAVSAAAFVINVATGSVSLPLAEVLHALVGSSQSDPASAEIVWQWRLPKALTASLAGAALSVSGLLMQTLFRNPLAGPFVLGINSGASLGVAFVLLSVGPSGLSLLSRLGWLGSLGLAAAAVAGAVSVLLLVLLAARRVDTLTLLVLGVLFGYTASALVSILLRFSQAPQIQSYVEWGFGGFGGVTWDRMRLMAPLLLGGLLLALLVAKPLNALLLGELYAQSLGLALRRARLVLIVCTALLAGVVTAFCGPIAFLGVAVPHLARGLMQTADHRRLLPAVALLGATVALLADLVAQLPGRATVLPLNAVTALIGAPVIVWVILHRPALRGTF